MTDFMTALHLILVQLTCPGDQRVNAVQFPSVCTLCRESHKTQVWLCFLVVSFLSISTCAASGGKTVTLFQNCFNVMREKNKVSLQKSDAMLYAPSVDDIKTDCEAVSLKCFMKELTMVLDEEEVHEEIQCVFDFDNTLTPPSDGCPVCETYPLRNITVFLERLDMLLKKMSAQSLT